MSTYDYESIGMAMMLGRRQGKTYNMVDNALKNSTIITANIQEVHRIKELAKSLGRSDLSVMQISPDFRQHCIGKEGPYTIDHQAVSILLLRAQKDIDDLKLQRDVYKKEVEKLQAVLQSIISTARTTFEKVTDLMDQDAS